MSISNTLSGFIKKVWLFIQENKNPLRTLLFISLLSTFAAVTFYFMKTKSFEFLETYSTYITFGFAAFLFIGFLIFLSQLANKNDQSKQLNILQQVMFYTKYLAFLGLGIGTLAVALYALTSEGSASVIILNVLFAASIIMGLYLAHSLISNTQLYQSIIQNKLLRVIYSALFVIPCYLIEGSTSVYKNVSATKPYVMYVLGAEVLILTAYFLLPLLFKTIQTHNMKELLDKPKYINREKTLATYEQLKQGSKKPFDYEYGISMKCFIDQNLPNDSLYATKDCTIFTYGNKPRITFNVKENKLCVFTRNGVDNEIKIYETTDVLLQKWNHIVINYKDGVMDVFINKKLVASQKNVVPYMTHDNIVIGTDEGIHGGIREVFYSSTPFTLSKMKLM